MRTSSKSVRKLSRRDDVAGKCGERVVTYLRGLYPERTADSVSADTGIKAGTVAKWIEIGCTPNGGALLLLVAAYGPDFLGAVLPAAPDWLRADMRAAEAAAALADLERARERLEALLARP